MRSLAGRFGLFLLALLIVPLLLVAAAAVAVAQPAGLLDGHTLTVAVDWLTGFTGHTDLGVGAAVAGLPLFMPKFDAPNDRGGAGAPAATQAAPAAPTPPTSGDGADVSAVVRAAVQETLAGLSLGDEVRRALDAEAAPASPAQPSTQPGTQQRQAHRQLVNTEAGANALPGTRQQTTQAPDPARQVRTFDVAGPHGTRTVTMTREAIDLTEDLMRSALSGDAVRQREAMDRLFERGYYAEVADTRDGFNTLTDGAGGVFLPTMISEHVYDIEKVYGVVPQYAMQLPIPVGREKIPNVVGQLTFFAIGEGAEMKARRISFGGITLDPHQWGVIVPWTLKMEREAGGKILPIVLRKIAEASAGIKDETFISGDGTSTYHNITGALARATAGDVSYSTPVADHDAFAELDADDYLMIQAALPASQRKRGIYVFHPDREYELMKLKDGDGRYIYGTPANAADGVGRLWGRPVAYTEKAPNTDGASMPYGLYFVPEFLAYGVGQSLQTDRLTEATIRDTDDSTLIRLGAQYSAALRVIEEFDLEFGDNTCFVVARTAS